MVKPLRKSFNKNPPILSHEFVIQNHADIVSCFVMLFIIGLMFQATTPFATIFIALQHNATDIGQFPVLYHTGIKDCAAVFFYSMICIAVHAIIQEYVIDKVSKRLHLSKSKLAIFTTSGQLAIFYSASTVWGLDIIIRERYLPDFSLLWADYPAPLPFMMKLFLIVQLAYCLHELPEIYFQRAKKEEYLSKAIHSVAGVALIALPYFLNFNRLLICLLVLHYTSELIIHIAQLIHTIDKDEKFTKVARSISVIILVLSRLGSIIFAVLTLWYGLALGEQREIDINLGYYNTLYIRLTVLAAILILQVYLTFNVISQELVRSRESKGFASVTRTSKPQKKDKSKKSKKASVEESDLPEVDQNTNKNLRNRSQKVK